MINTSKTHKLFEVPELLGSIYGYTDRRRWPGLLRISRAFFLAGVPLIWEEVVGIQTILKLLPSELLANNLEKPTEFARFDLYARFVKRLKVFSPDMAGYRVTGWRHLSDQSKSRVFLPNLLELAITPPSGAVDQNLFLWIRMFLSPSLTSIVVGAKSNGGLPVIPGLAVKALLGHVGATCQNLRQLQLFSTTAEDSNTSQERNEYIFADFWERSFFERLAGLRLQRLGCTTELVSPKWIHLLGEFSLLKSLDLYKDFRYEIVDVETIAELGLLGGLKSLTIVYEESDALDDGWEAGIILSISQNSPEPTKLHLEFVGEFDYMPDLASFRPLGTLPLTEDNMENLAAIWPNVIRFEMWDTENVSVSLKSLRYFAKLPRVQHLALPVSWFHAIPPPVTPAESSYALRTFWVLKRTLDADFDVSLLAQYLLSLWPNLESVSWPWADKLQPSDRETNTIIKALDNAVASQRKFNRLKSHIIDKCGLNVLDELLR
ncbi:hypothetical protein FRC09_016946 [Ceratobasidium sp. 395]|nr:hypothetical protein FRC09_016946 [Ceratobasidium sp. 395]